MASKTLMCVGKGRFAIGAAWATSGVFQDSDANGNTTRIWFGVTSRRAGIKYPSTLHRLHIGPLLLILGVCDVQ